MATKKLHSDFANQLLGFMKDNLNLIRTLQLTTLKEEYPHRNIVSYATYSPWVNDLDFTKIHESIRQHTLVDVYRCYELWQLVKQTSQLQGEIIEIGVWKGGTGALMAAAARQFCPQTQIHLVDTFSGVVKASAVHDTTYTGGEHSDTSVAVVQNLIDSLSLMNTVIHQGIYPEDVKINVESQSAFKLCHIDVDTYQSAKDIFDHIWPLICIGGVVVFDDYGFWGCEGVTKLVNELKLDDAFFVHNINGHALMIKTAH